MARKVPKKTKAGSQSAGLGDYVPVAPVMVLVAGASLAITPLVIGEFPQVFTLLKPIRAELGEITKIGMNELADLLATPAADAVIDLVAVAGRCDADWVRGLGADQFLALLSKVLEVNADFFTNRVLPALGQAMGTLAAKLPGA